MDAILKLNFKIRKKMKKLIVIGLIAFGLISCDSYLDINQDPNSPTEENLNPSLIFPGAEMNLANHYGDFLRIVGGYYAQHYAQQFGTSNYLDYSKWDVSAVRTNRAYNQLNTLCLKNLETVRELSIKSEDWGSYLAATVLRVYAYQVLVDGYGEIAYTEALDLSNLTPNYDEGQTVYEGILAELDEALESVSSSATVCKNFLFGTSSVTEWIQLANALKLKLLMRMSNVKDVKNDLAALIAASNFPTKDVAWTGFWADESGKANPFYLEEFATYFGSTQINVTANLSIVQTMLDSNDARIGYVFSKNTSGNYTGGISGTNYKNPGTYVANYWCRPNIRYNSPVFLITVSEIEFFLAEYYARYGGGDASTHYNAAVEASFQTSGATGADAVLAAYPWDGNNYRQVIGIQKWVALSGVNNFEAWCELRRLKYPEFGTVSGTDLYNIETDAYSPDRYTPGTLYTPIQCNAALGANKVLQRFKYAEYSSSRNPNVPAAKGDGEPVFWAK
jgi:hypothetical protein